MNLENLLDISVRMVDVIGAREFSRLHEQSLGAVWLTYRKIRPMKPVSEEEKLSYLLDIDTHGIPINELFFGFKGRG